MKIVAKALLKDSSGRVLLLRRGPTHPNFAGHVDFPGGEVEPDERYAEAVRREIQEETGINVSLEDLDLVHSQRLNENLKHVVFIATVNDEDVVVELSWEHSSFDWVPLAEFVATPLPHGVDTYHLTVLDYLRKK